MKEFWEDAEYDREDPKKEAPEDTRPNAQKPVSVYIGLGDIHRTVRAYKRGALASRPYSYVAALIEKDLARTAFDAWEQGKKAHPDCENPYKDKS